MKQNPKKEKRKKTPNLVYIFSHQSRPHVFVLLVPCWCSGNGSRCQQFVFLYQGGIHDWWQFPELNQKVYG
jgi:hypothetical protein